MIIDDNNVVVVGAGLVPAHDVVLSDDGSIVGASDHDVVPVNTRATTRVAPTLGHVIGTYKSLVPIQPFNYLTASSLLAFHLSPITHHPLPITHYCLFLPLPLIPSLDRGGKIVDNPSPSMKGEARACPGLDPG